MAEVISSSEASEIAGGLDYFMRKALRRVERGQSVKREAALRLLHRGLARANGAECRPSMSLTPLGLLVAGNLKEPTNG